MVYFITLVYTVFFILLWWLGSFIANFQYPYGFIGHFILALDLFLLANIIKRHYITLKDKNILKNFEFSKFSLTRVFIFLTLFYFLYISYNAYINKSSYLYEGRTFEIKSYNSLVKVRNKFVEGLNYFIFPFTRRRIPPALPYGFPKPESQETVVVTVGPTDKRFIKTRNSLLDLVYNTENSQSNFRKDSGGYLNDFEWHNEDGTKQKIKANSENFFFNPQNPQDLKKIERIPETMLAQGYEVNAGNTFNNEGFSQLGFTQNTYKCLIKEYDSEIKQTFTDVYGNAYHTLQKKVELVCGPIEQI